MATRGLLLVAIALTACDAEDPSAACHGDRPIQLLATSDLHARAESSATQTYIIAMDTPTGVGGTFIGPDCGAATTLTLPGITLVPARTALDPADDDPTIACDPFNGQMYRVDPTGAEPPQLVLPWLRCPGTPTPHGPLFLTNDLSDGATWLIPDFPDESTTVRITDVPGGVIGDHVYFLGQEGALHRVDLRTRATEHVADDVASLRVTATHALVKSNVDPDVAPMHLVDIAAGTRTYLGLYHADEDAVPGRHIDVRYAWDFDPTGRYVLHAGAAPSPMAAFDLTGAPVAFPAHGERLMAHPDGTFVIFDHDATYAARPGDPDVVRLDFVDDPDETNAPVVVGDHVELIVEGDLYSLPLDGGPRRLLAREIGAVREWLDDKHLLTIVRDQLMTVVAATQLRRSFGAFAVDYTRVPGRGVFFTNYAGEDAPTNGVWFAPEAALYPQVTPCQGSFWCR